MAALEGSSSRRSLVDVLASDEGQLQDRRVLSLLPTGEKLDWELNRRDIFRQLVEAWIPRTVSGQIPGTGTMEEVERRALDL